MRLFVIAGEPSGDRLGAALMAGLRTLQPDVAFAGVGGPAMAAEGLESLFPMQELSVMGLLEVLPKYRHLQRRIAQTAAAAVAAAPDAVITIDSPDFCLRVLRLVRAARPAQRTVHYVAPSVWAWRPGRAARMAPLVDHVLALLPFEPPYMEAAGMSCDFVGHPAAAGVPAGVAAVAAFRDRHGLGAAPVVLALPGSRRGEVARLAPRFGAALGQAVPAGVRVVLPTLPAIAREVRAAAAGWPVAPLVVEAGPDRDAAFATARAALAASGTVSLELAAHGVPMVIGYDFNPVSRFLIWRMARIDTVTLVNLVSGTRAVPEFLGTRCRAELMAPALAALLQEGPERDAQAHAMAVTMARLGRGGEAPGLRAARSVLAALARPGRPGGAPALRP